MTASVDVVIPARRDSQGLPGKNVKVLVDRPLTLHSVACAFMIPGVRRVLVTTDDDDLRALAVSAGAEAPEKRPEELVRSDTPMADVVCYAADLLARTAVTESDFILLLDPTSPLRMPTDIAKGIELLRQDPGAVGVVSVSTPAFNPLWVGVNLLEGGVIERHPMSSGVFTRRQDVPSFLRINGSFYVWRTWFARTLQRGWLDDGCHLGVETREVLSHSIDSADDFAVVESLLMCKVITLPWLDPN